MSRVLRTASVLRLYSVATPSLLSVTLRRSLHLRPFPLSRAIALSPVRHFHQLSSTPPVSNLLPKQPSSLARAFVPSATSYFQHPLSTAAAPELLKNKRVYSWVDAEAETLIAKAYERHQALADKSQSFPPSLSMKELEKIGKPVHFEPQDWLDKCAYGLMRVLRVFTHAFFRKKYDHHAVVLETVAAVPGIVGAFHRHLRSLRRMERDHGWINHLLEESENERMHLLIFMKVTKPNLLERGLVVLAQGAYLAFYSALYLCSGRAAHRFVGYLEEEAHLAYTDYIRALDSGELEMKPAPEIAKQYYRLGPNATIKDVVLHVRADESMHRDTNHHWANKYKAGDLDSPPIMMSTCAREQGQAVPSEHQKQAVGELLTDLVDEGKQASGDALTEPIEADAATEEFKETEKLDGVNFVLTETGSFKGEQGMLQKQQQTMQ